MESQGVARLKDGLWAVVFAGVAAAIIRFGLGLGAATGLNDATPWGLWIAFKLGFVALAGGGFTLAALVYIFHLERYRVFVRRAILLALLGYGSFIVSLLFDLGLPWHIYMPILYWQHHSVMFEIAWCVMLYFTVLLLEFAPVILEHRWFQHFWFRRMHQFLHRAVVPLVIAGVVLSTLHQSSLGSLFLILPHRVHPLWYSPWIPVLFFISAIAAGIMALILESFVAEHLFRSTVRLDLLERLAATAAVALLLYLGLRVGDLFQRGVLPGGLDGSWQSLLFGGEILAGGVLPAVLLLAPGVRRSRAGLVTCSLLAVGGILSQRLSLSMFTLWRPEGSPYSPSGYEILIAVAIPAAAGLIYLLFSEQLALYPDSDSKAAREAAARPDLALPELYRAGWQTQLYRRSGIAVIVISLTFAALPSEHLNPPAPVNAARGWTKLVIDSRRDGMQVEFPHVEHQERLAGQQGDAAQACRVCHHLNLPDDEGTGCGKCHQDAYTARSIFNHNLHTQALEENASCQQCHVGEHRAATAAPCVDCHAEMVSAPNQESFSHLAPGYLDIMHGKCITCHTEQAEENQLADLEGCATCHFQPSQHTETVLSFFNK
jgi:Ni/Fe-hydrogenase subunit HybB-like protein